MTVYDWWVWGLLGTCWLEVEKFDKESGKVLNVCKCGEDKVDGKDVFVRSL